MSASSSSEYQLSLPTAVLININIMLGAGIFINTPALAQKAGPGGGLIYLIVGLMMLPLIVSIAELLRLHPSGGFYRYARNEMHPLMGFLSGWSYFTSKVASCMLMIHVSVTLIQRIFPFLLFFSPFLLDFLIVSLFCGLNLLNIKAGSKIQKMFICFKTLPIFFALAACFFFIDPANLSRMDQLGEGLTSSLPLVVYAIIGFEAACSMSSKIKNASRNAPLAVLISFISVIGIATVYQTVLYAALGPELSSASSHSETFPLLIGKVWGNSLWAQRLEAFIHLAIASSTLGAAYGIIFSNSWNLHILAENGHIPGSRWFTQLNRSSIPYACVLIEGLLCLSYLTVSQGVLVPLQQIGALGCVISYTFSVAALLYAKRSNPDCRIPVWVPIFGLVSCDILMTACIRSFFLNGMSSLVIFSALLLMGIGMFYATSRRAAAPAS